MSRSPQNEGVPPEYPPIGDKEYGKLPDEFNRDAVAVRRPKRVSRLKKVMLYMASAGLISLGVLFPNFRAAEGVVPPAERPSALASEAARIENTAAPTDVRSSPAPTPGAIAETTDMPTEPSASAPTEPTTPVPTAVPYPLRQAGTIAITVYADLMDPDFDWTAPNYDELFIKLASETFDEATFETYPLPPLPSFPAYTAVGYVVQSIDTEAFLLGSDTPFRTRPLGTALTKDDVTLVPVDENGVRNVIVHTMWRATEGDMTLILDDGEGQTTYPVGFPIASEGLCYLAAYPAPMREGRTFSGWYDADGNAVSVLSYFDFFEPLPDARTLEDRDWSKPVAVTLYARWS